MFDEGLVDEVRRLSAGSRPWSDVAAQGVGYKEVLDLLAGRASEAETTRGVQLRTRQFSKRQATWFRGLTEVPPWPVVAEDIAAEATADQGCCWRSKRSARAETDLCRDLAIC